MKWLAIIIVFSVAARAAQTNWPSAVGKPEKARAVTVEKYKVKAEKQKNGKQKNGKKEMREFPLMFDIADKASKHKTKKAGKK